MKSGINKYIVEEKVRVCQLCNWLQNKDDALTELFNECKTVDDVNIITGLIKHTIVVNSNAIDNLLSRAAYKISRDLLPHEIPVISAATWGASPDSSRYIMQRIKRHLVYRSIKAKHMYDDLTIAGEKAKQLPHSRLFLVDEFFGSGSSILKYNEYLSSLHLDKYSFIFLFGMRHSYEELVSKGVNVTALIRLKRYSDKMSLPEYRYFVRFLLRTALSLKPQVGKRLLIDVVLGYGLAEACYSSEIETGNSPNSNYAILWWPRTHKDDPRKVMFTRCEKALIE